jgi:ferrochelatase
MIRGYSFLISFPNNTIFLPLSTMNFYLTYSYACIEFLYNLFADPDIIRLPGPLSPLQNVIASFIAKRRAPKSRAAYATIGGGSPILEYTNAQADLLSKSLKDQYDLSVKTYVGMRYWKPYTEDALQSIRKDKIKALVIVPLYPQFSISTSGSSLRVLQEEFAKEATSYGDMVHTVVPSWYDRPGYVKAVSNLIQAELDSFTDSEIDQAKKDVPNLTPLHILFSAHGVPKSYIEAGDPYQQQMEKCVAIITKKLYETNSPKDVTIHLSYQSRVGPIEWLRPVCIRKTLIYSTNSRSLSSLSFVFAFLFFSRRFVDIYFRDDLFLSILTMFYLSLEKVEYRI